ncbi:serine/threonine-protein kinase [Chondromyces apiculatus]|uniref:Serine/threonine protein kinase n=1 Tax=Chondromyces apiculatus DSM 436 TaxID=1192034 RepID=A0A017T7Y6_9BACT|nr:serine/threonine-protein kinase [Chondromyces apiculatus]EYF04706.1 serine/threonine protein kinase [Chondromyces apiculatus DSM 436]
MSAPPFVPELFGDFLLIQRLARSAMAEVLVAVRLGDRSGRTFVVKRPLVGERASGRAAQAIAREAEVLEAVRAAGLPALEAAGEIAGLPYVALEHVRGVALDELLGRGSALPPEAAVGVGRDLARALSALHAAGWVHGDVTPSNVIVDDAGEARLLDLGIARRAGERRDEVAGKPGYVAPEAALAGTGSVASTAEDTYGLGVVLAECVLGRRLFAERDVVEAATRAELPREMAALEQALPGVSAALARRPEQRPTVEALRATLEGLPVDRGLLAEYVLRAGEQASVGPTPTAPMVMPGRPEPTLAGTPTPGRVAVNPGPEEARGARGGHEGSHAGEHGAGLGGGPANSAQGGDAIAARIAEARGLPAPVAPAAALAPVAPVAPAARLPWVALTLGFALVLVVGILIGRAGDRRSPGKLSIAGTLPRRSQLELDSKPFSMPIGGGVTLSPGAHTLAIVLPRGNRREYTFQVRPNEHIVILPSARREDGDGEGEP